MGHIWNYDQIMFSTRNFISTSWVFSLIADQALVINCAHLPKCRIPLERQIPVNRQFFSNDYGSGSDFGGCDFDPWVQVTFFSDIYCYLNFDSHHNSGTQKINFRNVTRPRSGVTLATTTTTCVGTATTVFSRYCVFISCKIPSKDVWMTVWAVLTFFTS